MLWIVVALVVALFALLLMILNAVKVNKSILYGNREQLDKIENMLHNMSLEEIPDRRQANTIWANSCHTLRELRELRKAFDASNDIEVTDEEVEEWIEFKNKK
ncbi:hypothetical protein [Klebsiella aerogenes]|uniref:hypothetical protein n=1 Tax=Klebsiella aerogenes TaxID=548 RepID=UPI00379CEE8C